MAIIGTLLSVNQPSGVWISIIQAFEKVTNNYVLGIIFLTVVIRLIWSLVELLTKYSQQKMNKVQVLMQPELEKVRAKYSNQPQIQQQKENEIYKRYMGKKTAGSCVVMIITMVLNMVVFFTLFTGLNTMATYKMSANYDNLKYTYVNCINVTDKYFEGNYNDLAKQEVFKDYENLAYKIGVDADGNKNISLVKVNADGSEEVLATDLYKNEKDFESVIPAVGETPEKIVSANENIIKMLDKIFPKYEEGEEVGSKEIVIYQTPALDKDGNPVVDENGNTVYDKLYLSTAIQSAIMEEVNVKYDQNKDSFLWIENIWLADSPFQNSVVDFNTIKSQLGTANVKDGEEQIFNAFMQDIKEAKNRENGYYILPLLCVAFTVLSMYTTTWYNKLKAKKKGQVYTKPKNGLAMQIILPILLGIFALFYNSVFSIYMVTGQVISMILSPLQLLIVDKIIEKQEKKKDKDKVVVDYSRKF